MLVVIEDTYLMLLFLQNGDIFFLFRENMPPQDADIGHRNPLKQTNKAKRVS